MTEQWNILPVYDNRWGVFRDGRLDLHFPTEEEAKAYVEKKEKIANCVHVWEYEDDEYGSLGDGGSYEVYVCTLCDKRSYSPLPD